MTVLKELSGLANVSLSKEKLTLHWYFPCSVEEWLSNVSLFSKEDGSTGVRRTEGVLSQAISEGRDVVIHNVGRMPNDELSELAKVIFDNPQTHFSLVE